MISSDDFVVLAIVSADDDETGRRVLLGHGREVGMEADVNGFGLKCPLECILKYWLLEACV